LKEYKQKLDDTEKITQENIGRLEQIEKLIHEQVIDCGVIVDEYRHTLNDILSAARSIGDTIKNEITEEEKNDLETLLDIVLSESNEEINQLKNTETSHSAFLEYSRIIKEQQAISSEINRNVSEINAIRSKIENLLSSINDISNMYCKARESLYKGSYQSSIELISQAHFDIIIQRVLKGDS